MFGRYPGTDDIASLFEIQQKLFPCSPWQSNEDVLKEPYTTNHVAHDGVRIREPHRCVDPLDLYVAKTNLAHPFRDLSALGKEIALIIFVY